MEILKGYKVELDPNNKQCTLLLQCTEVARWAWNWGLERKIKEYEETGKVSSAIDQHKQLNVLKKTEYPWLYDYSKCIPQEALRDLGKAYKSFYRRMKNGKEKLGFPKFKSQGCNIGSFRLTGFIRVEDSRIRFPRIGWLRLKECNYIPTEDIHILSATVSRKANKWFVSVQCREEIEVNQATGAPVGIDLGIKTLAVCSDERQFENPRALQKARRKLRRLHRELSRRKKDSQNRKKTKAKIAKLHSTITCIQKDALHKATSAVVARANPSDEKPSIVVVEDLDVSEIVKNRCFSKSAGSIGLAEFRRQIEYKTTWAGEEVMVADRFFPSSKMCHCCNYINSKLKITDRKWTCVCGATLDRDLNAAINLRNLAVRRVPSESTPVERI